MKKRQINTTGLRIKYLAPTNTKGGRFKITQLNCNKSITISANINTEPINFFSTVLEFTKELETFSLVVDNTQNDSYMFNLNFKGNSFTNILNNFK